jgi:predicted ATPase/DNA-binding winged helix-turn-helix (wHTH) protein
VLTAQSGPVKLNPTGKRENMRHSFSNRTPQHTKPPPSTFTGLGLLEDLALDRNGKYAKCFGSFRLLPDKRLLMEGDKPVRIGSRTLDLLIALVDRPGELIRKEELMALVWPNTHVEPCNLSVHIARLRQILGDGRDGKRFVINISGRGYRFVADVTTDVESSPPLAVDAMHNLPAPFTRLIGREDAMADLVLQLKQHRLLTVVGPGGIGKSSVAQAVARELVARFKDGIWLIDLGTLTDAQLVPDALRSALGFKTQEKTSIEGMIANLRDKSMLLLLDNCAHVVSAAARLAEAVLRDAPGVQVLATSCEPLRILGEQVYRLPPLECPPASAQPTADAALRFPAVRLFVERGCNLHSEFGFCDADAPLVASICRRLDGIPLAIKSAAAGVSFLGLQGLSESLDDSLGLPTNISRSASQRQHSMRATLDWSYGLLSESQRLVLRRLSIFPSEFTLRAAGAVISDEGRSHVDIVPLIGELVTKSLVIAETGGAEPRLRLLHTTRAHAFAKLAESGELDAVRRRFAECTRQQRAEAVQLDKPAHRRNKQEA